MMKHHLWLDMTAICFRRILRLTPYNMRYVESVKVLANLVTGLVKSLEGQPDLQNNWLAAKSQTLNNSSYLSAAVREDDTFRRRFRARP